MTIAEVIESMRDSTKVPVDLTTSILMLSDAEFRALRDLRKGRMVGSLSRPQLTRRLIVTFLSNTDRISAFSITGQYLNNKQKQACSPFL